jgi:hypothetical protein
MSAESPGSGPQTTAARWAEGLAAVRAAHLSLRRSTADAAPDDKRRQIQDFLDAASEAGAFIAGINDRRDAQNILDYWCFELASLRQSGPDAAADPSHFVPKLLAPFDASRASEPERAIARSTDEQRELIRLSAQARQYVNSGEYKGYLLSGDAIEKAARFRNVDNNIALLVEKSQTAAVRKKYAYAGNFGVLISLLLILGAIIALSYVITEVARRITTQAQTGTSVATTMARIFRGSGPATDLWLLAYFQPWSKPYDLSSKSELSNIDLPGLRLYAPNFTGVRFRNVSFPNAVLPAASFTESLFSFEAQDDDKRNDFEAADMARTQFRGAKVSFASFRGADLLRAVFDRSVLCDVDFTGANLRSASFWAATLDPLTEQTLQYTAWWLAVGWPWSEIKRLNIPDTDRAKTHARLYGLQTSPGFKKDMAEPTEAFNRSSSGTLLRARALNEIAWIYAVWGLCISEPDNERPDGIAWHASFCAKDLPDGFPKSARDAARRAVKTVTELTAPDARDAVYAEFLANLKDTLAYVYIEGGELANALKTYQEISKESQSTIEAGETSFRYAIAQYAAAKDGQDTDAEHTREEAVKLFEKAIYEKRYQPTHELQTLKPYIFGNKKFEGPLENSTKILWPTSQDLETRPTESVPGVPKCPERKSAKTG